MHLCVHQLSACSRWHLLDCPAHSVDFSTCSFTPSTSTMSVVLACCSQYNYDGYCACCCSCKDCYIDCSLYFTKANNHTTGTTCDTDHLCIPESALWEEDQHAFLIARADSHELPTCVPFAGSKHVRCSQKCNRALLCGHECGQPCHGGSTCPPCQRACTAQCVHGQCRGWCTDLCAPCTEPCIWQCEHQV